jgi:hypothetical protein
MFVQSPTWHLLRSNATLFIISDLRLKYVPGNLCFLKSELDSIFLIGFSMLGANVSPYAAIESIP